MKNYLIGQFGNKPLYYSRTNGFAVEYDGEYLVGISQLQEQELRKKYSQPSLDKICKELDRQEARKKLNIGLAYRSLDNSGD